MISDQGNTATKIAIAGEGQSPGPVLLQQRPRLSGAIPQLSDKQWTEIASALDVALQPVVNLHTGVCYGYEALMRNYSLVGFDSIAGILDAAAFHDKLVFLEKILIEKAFTKFRQLVHQRQAKLFLNLDFRTLAALQSQQLLSAWCMEHGIEPSQVAIEISERIADCHSFHASQLFAELKSSGLHLAIDDFGAGFSGLGLLYTARPDFVKIDRAVVAGLERDSKKKLFLSHVLIIAHLLGMAVIAEGVETDDEYFVCKEVGCDLIQGYLVQRPALATEELLPVYAGIEALTLRDRRSGKESPGLVRSHVKYIEPVKIGTSLEQVFQRFRTNKRQTFFPVVDNADEPLGIVREEELKDFTYSYYGKDLIANRNFGRKLGQFVNRCPIADINASADMILQTYATMEEAEGILMVDNLKYVGFLGTRALLHLINEKSMSAARDQNPLTKLPGNNVIYEYVSRALEAVQDENTFCYFDFDNFKPFNDKYGFRLGDRAILLFAELMNKLLPANTCFIGHIGGDDFFAGLHGLPRENAVALCRALIEVFRHEVESFYSEEDRQAGFVTGVDRQGRPAQFPLLSVSTAVLHLSPNRRRYSLDEVSSVIASMKKDAKQSADHLHVETHGSVI